LSRAKSDIVGVTIAVYFILDAVPGADIKICTTFVKVECHLDKTTVVLERNCAAKNRGTAAADDLFRYATLRNTAHDGV